MSNQVARRPATPRQQSDLLDLLAILIAGGLVALTVAGHPSTPRLLLTLAFTFFVPGRVIVANWPWVARWSEAAMAVVLSVTVLSLVAAVVLWAHEWHPVGLAQIEAVVCIAGLITATIRRRVRPSHRTA